MKFLFIFLSFVCFLKSQVASEMISINKDSIILTKEKSTYLISTRKLGLHNKSELFGNVLFETHVHDSIVFVVNFYQSSSKKGRCSSGEEHFLSLIIFDKISRELIKFESILFSSCLLQIEPINLVPPIERIHKENVFSISFSENLSLKTIHFDPNHPQKGIY